MTLHPDIERLALLGWRLYPASQYSRAACIKNAADLATPDLDQLSRWSREFPGCGWRVVMQGSGIWALDVDVPSSDHAADGMAALAPLVAAHAPLPPRPTARSGGGGCALLFRHNGEPISGKTGTPTPGLDPRRERRKPECMPDDLLVTAKESAVERKQGLSTFWCDVRAGGVPPPHYYISPRCPAVASIGTACRGGSLPCSGEGHGVRLYAGQVDLLLLLAVVTWLRLVSGSLG